ncbi:MAG: M48 family metalloprotease [Acidobacteriaceae bacterium]|nr:M48 family metalloprotease [Acidobacteriaceae bacterium]MBV9226666.1 M48 family metalloprotease [Acidobacteriaceae bacterium]MBV9674885.1 M48 family metalloprotease [Acidobacteriaceae bacterium]MBV9937097.1 M48 family metalloprotease [Acidobacteriaceae bacterium]
MRRFVHLRSSVSLLLACLLSVPSASFAGGDKEKNSKKDPDAIGDRNVSGKVNFYSLEKEIALGKSLAQQVERQSKVINDPIVAEYVNRVGQNLVRNSDAKVPFTIKVIEDPVVNAFALPGGFFFVQSGLILKADTEAELAGVMAHEIAHVAARHATRQATRGEIAQLATIPLIFMGGAAAYGIYQASGLLVPLTFLKFSRGQEAEADYLGVQYMYKTGYDPTAFVDFFEKIQTLEKRKPGTVSKLFSTHPPTDDRIEKTQKEVSELKARPEYVVTTSEFNDVKARLAMLENQRRPDKANEDPNKPTLRRNPNSTAPIEDETDPSKKSKGDEDDRPKLKRRPSDGGDANSTSTPPPSE